MGPVLALKYFRYTYRSSKINILQQAERLGGPILSLGSIEPQSRSLEKDLSPLSISQPKNRNSVYEPLLSESPNATRRSFGPGPRFDFFQSQSVLSSSYTRKDNWYLWFLKEKYIIGVFELHHGNYDQAVSTPCCPFNQTLYSLASCVRLDLQLFEWTFLVILWLNFSFTFLEPHGKNQEEFVYSSISISYITIPLRNDSVPKIKLRCSQLSIYDVLQQFEYFF